MPFERGEVVLVLFPDSNLKTGKKRPALIVQANMLKTGLPQRLVAMITSNMARAGHPSRVSVTRLTPLGGQMGLLADSVIMTDNLATVHEAALHRSIGRCNDMGAIDAALRHSLAL